MGAFKPVALMVLLLVKLIYCAEHYVKENSSSTCPINFCLTLNQYLRDSTKYFTSWSTFVLLPGQHHLNVTLTLSGVTNITFRGDDTGISTITGGNTLKNCTGIVLEDSTSLQIQNVQFNGGALFSQGIRVVNSTASFVNCSFTNWHSHHHGGAIFVNTSNVSFLGTTIFSKNTANKSGGGIYVYNSNANFSGNSTFLENNSGYKGAGLYSNNSHITFNGSCTFKLNYAGRVGGGICITKQSTLAFTHSKEKGSAEINFINNSAWSGGALVAQEKSRVDCEGNMNFINNSANGTCGGICILHSNMSCSGNIIFQKNSAVYSGGGMHAIGGTVNFTGSYSFLDNMAKHGGGMALEKTKLQLYSPVTMNFTSNRAIHNGGGILIINCNHLKILTADCFTAIDTNNSSAIQNIRLYFRENSAGLAGSVLHGGALEDCPIPANNETNLTFFEISNISKSTNETVPRFSSDAVKLCSCDVNLTTIKDCNQSNTRIIHATPGIHFNMSVIALGQKNEPVPSIIRAYINNGEDSTTLRPPSHKIEGCCTNITLQIFPENMANKTLTLYPDGPCSTDYTSLVTLKCPPGFTLNDGQCRCSVIQIDEVIKCVGTNYMLQIERLGNSWIDTVNDNMSSSNLSFMYHIECPLNYCRTDNPIPLNFTNYSSTILCSSNRTGKLCGECVEGYSLTLNRFNCIECDNKFISLLLYFAFAGVTLIAVLLVLHMTVAAGTINGLILYANIVNVNSFIFFPSHSSNKFTAFLTVFISWLNLDFGIETCFYNGLNAYIYAWLEYVFPLYLWFLIGAIIVSNRLSAKVGMLFGANPVAVLATVILMSYTKLFQAALVSLHYTSLKYSRGHKSTKVWYYDANFPYFGNVQHISLAITALCMIGFLLVPYIFLLLFSYRIQAFSRKRAFSWLNKIKPLLDAYYAPYRAKTRYWPGLMLLVRGCLYTAFLVTDRSDNLIAILFVFTAVALMPWLGHRVYEKFYNDVLEASFILNICLLSAASYHVHTADSRYQKIVTCLSISIAFLQFLGIVAFHLYLRLKNIKPFVLFKSCLAKKLLLHPKESEEEKPANNVKEVSMTVMDLREPLLESQQL